MSHDGDFGSDYGDYGSSGGDGDGDPRWPEERALRVLNRPAVESLRTVCVLVMFFGWTPLTLLDGTNHTWNDEHAFWWRFTLFGWMACSLVFAVISVVEKLAHRRRRRRILDDTAG